MPRRAPGRTVRAAPNGWKVKTMVSTSYPTADQRRRWRRIELISWTGVAALSATAFVLLVMFVNVAPVVAFLGILVALDLPFCLDLIWRAGREDPV
jgi:hypothetical protein